MATGGSVKAEGLGDGEWANHPPPAGIAAEGGGATCYGGHLAQMERKRVVLR